MNNLSATIITLNEEDNIEECIKSIKELVDEIIVVDSGSKDKTVEKAKDLGAKVFFHEFVDYASQKNWAMNKALGEWIFSLDADERITPELGAEIKKVIAENNYSGFLMPRRNFILGGEIKFTRWSPDRHIWLWKKSFGKWVGDVHEEVVLEGQVGQLKAAKLHYSHRTVGEFLRSNNKYSTLAAKQLFKQGVNFSVFKMFKEAIFEFCVRYLYKKGFLDGWRGLVLSCLMAIYKLTVWIKLAKLQRK